MAKSSIWLKLKVIIWKNFVIRKHHWFLSLCEIIVPTVLFILIAYARSEISGMGKRYVTTPTYNIEHSSEKLYYNNFNHAFKIYYAPTTSFSSKLIHKVQMLFSLPSEAIVSFSTVTDLNAYYDKNGRNETGIMAVIFNNLAGDSTPNHLNYVIRPFEKYVDWETQTLFNPQHNYIPELGSERYINTGFLAIKMALDTSFLEMAIGEKPPVTFVLQEFPYPPHYDDVGITDMFLYVLPLVTVFSFVFLCPAVLKRIVEEKSTGIKELMKMMGLKSWMLWLGWFLHAFVINLISICLITFFMKVALWDAKFPPIEYCSGSLFLVFLLLYIAAGITFCFAISSLFSRPTLAMVAGILAWIISYVVPSGFVDQNPNMKWYKKMLLGIFPNMALSFGYKTIAIYEAREIGSNWSNICNSPSGGNEDVTMAHVFIIFAFDIVFYVLITLYVECVNPGPYGLAKPFTFPLTCISNVIFKRSSRVVNNEEDDILKEYCKIEPATNMTPGIQIKNLYKVFGNQSAVNGLSMDIYEGEITALLGHNGAGKTTTMSIMTGMIGATSGRVIINGKDIQTNMTDVRTSLGLCPQHNLQFTDLTVFEHLMFFGMLKGLSKKEAINEAQSLLDRMNLSQKKHSLASCLSGGMRRKLSLSIALIGNSKVLILDEPTSGLDPEARREIWDMLLTLRGSRTIVITTHFMEEADVLGDRIAIMDHGRLMCYGTSMFLKKEFGAGYHLTLTRDSGGGQVLSENRHNQTNEISTIVKRIIPHAVLQADTGNNLTFLLPHESKSYFSQLLEELEGKKSVLRLSNISMSVTTLEEVFLSVGKLASEDDRKMKSLGRGSLKSHGTISSTSSCSSTSVKFTGGKKTKLQLLSLLKKRILVARKKWFIYTVQILLALLITILTLYLGDTVNQSTSDVFKSVQFNLSAYGETRVFYGGTEADSELTKFMEQYDQLTWKQSGTPTKVPSVSGAILDEGVENIEFYKQHMIVAAEFNKTSDGGKIVNAMYSNNALHGAPISLNLVMNAVLKGTMGNDYSITSGNTPLPVTRDNHFEEASEIEVGTLWFILFPLGILFLSATFLLFPHMERVSNIKQLQLMCGVRSVFYWASCYIWDLVLYFTAIMIIIMVVITYGCIFSNIFSGMNEIGALLAILSAYGLSIIPFSYLFSYKKTAGGGFASFLMSSLFISIVMTIVVFLLQLSNVERYEKLGRNLKYIFLLFPQFGLTFSSLQFSRKAVWNYNWKNKSPEQIQQKCYFDDNPCCDGYETQRCINYRSYLCGHDGIGINILEMLCSTTIYFTILLLLETNFIHKLWNKFLVFVYNQIHHNAKFNTDAPDGRDKDDVMYESERVFDTLKREKNGSDKVHKKPNVENNETDDLLLVHNLEKIYWGQKVVKGVSFGIKPGDCFGLLGVNGAGKTTTFRMLTGDEPLINGEARIRSTDAVAYISKEMKKYLENVGYCPQFDAINEVLTGREMLHLFAQLRGISEGIEEEVNMWLAALGLDEYADKLCGEYSGGNKRKLSMAVALIGGPLLVMLDEPTSGVDPISRRKLWDTLNMIQNQVIKPSIILTSHSMEECEALCNKLAIMKDGQLECYGTIPKLKEKYGQGFTVMLKLKPCLLNIIINPLGMDDSDSTASQSQPLSSTRRTSTYKNEELPNILDDPEEVKSLMACFGEKYKGFCTLRDKHSGLLHYHLNDKKKKWSELFKEIEELKQQHPVIEDYNISETTLEEVFLSIARSDLKSGTEIVL